MIKALPLWPASTDRNTAATPDWIERYWNFLRAYLDSRQGENWRVWTDWYQDRLDGKPIDWELERARLQPPETWEAGPKALNDAIARRLEEIEAERRAAATPPPDPLIEAAALGDVAPDPQKREMRIVPRPAETPLLAEPTAAADYANKLETLALDAADLAEDVARDYPNIGKGFPAQLNRYAALLQDATPQTLNPDRFFSLGQGLLDLNANEDISDALPVEYDQRLQRLADLHRVFAHAYYARTEDRRAPVDALPTPAPEGPAGDPGGLAEAAADLPEKLVADVAELPPLSADDRLWLEGLAEDVRRRGVDLALLDGARREAERAALYRIVRSLVATVKVYADKAVAAASSAADAVPDGVRHSLLASASYDAITKLIRLLFP
ncbi:MAG: hypothetical protein AAF763_14195 [Pseudomonadota bacterium]